MSDERCEWSDLPPEQCDHCRTDGPQTHEVARQARLESQATPNTSGVIRGAQNGENEEVKETCRRDGHDLETTEVRIFNGVVRTRFEEVK